MQKRNWFAQAVGPVLIITILTALWVSRGNALSPAPVQAQDESNHPYYTTKIVTLADGTRLAAETIGGPARPHSSGEIKQQSSSQDAASPVKPNADGDVVLPVPAYGFSYGSGPTAAAMIAAYYDRNGYPNIYTGPQNGKVMPMDNRVWGTWTDGSQLPITYEQNPLAASRNGLDGRTAKGSIDDYWVQLGSDAADPYIGHWTAHTWDSAIGDYMKTGQSAYGNPDGGTTFYTYLDEDTLEPLPNPLPCAVMDLPPGPVTNDGSQGRRDFYIHRGYAVSECYNQYTDNKAAGGFSFASYKAQIDAGRPVLLNLEGDSVVGFGYNPTGSTVYLYDTWSHDSKSMVWGTSYDGMKLSSVSIVTLASLVNCATPAAPALSSPGSGSTSTDNTPTFSWGASANSNAYDLQVDNDQDFTSPYIGTTVTTTSYTPTVLLPNGLYYWRVSGRNTSPDCNNTGSWSATWTLTINAINNPPDNFKKSQPSKGLTGVPTNPTLSWGSSSGVEKYYYCYYKASGGTCTWQDNGLATSKPLTGLAPGTTYNWQVYARNANGTTYADSNEVWSFTTQPASIQYPYKLRLPVMVKP